MFGINDGLVSNLSLVLGVAGAAPSPRFILLAGVAGLLAGSFSMGAGEYISISSQRELFERQLELEKEELIATPEEEEAELGLIYRGKRNPSGPGGIARKADHLGPRGLGSTRSLVRNWGWTARRLGLPGE